MDGDQLAVGVRYDNGHDNNASISGAAYMFELSQTTWSDTDKLQEHESLNSSSWQNFKTANSTAPACTSADSSKFGTASNAANSIAITSSDNNKWACFRVKDKDNTYSYIKKQIDLTPPTVTITQTEDSLQATTTATDLPTNPVWQYSLHSTNPTCSTTNKEWINGSKAKYISFTSYYCFRVADSSNNHGYGKIKPTIPDPGLVIKQTPTKISAIATSTYALSMDASDEFGRSVSLDGDRLAIGAPYDDGKSNSTTNAGAVYIFKRTGTTWVLERKIEDGSDGFNNLDTNDRFGRSVSLDGDRLVVGAYRDSGKNNSTTNAGAVYIFKRTGATWSLERKIEDGSDGFYHLDANDWFSFSVSLDGDRLAVGSHYDDGKNNSTTNAGAVYIFKRTGTTWALERKIEDGSSGFHLDARDEFSRSVSLDGDRLAVGAYSDDGKNDSTANVGAVYIFKRTAATWALERKIEDGSDGFNHLDSGDLFGLSISLDGDRLAVGAQGDDGKSNSTTNAGAVYIFKRTGTTWALERKIEDGSDGFNHLDISDVSDGFGRSVSLDGDRLAVGSHYDDGKNNSTFHAGAVYIFKRTGTTWALERKIEDGSSGFHHLDANDWFGRSVSLDGDRLAVGAYLDDGHDNGSSKAGAVYMFERSGGTWTDTDKFQEQEGLVASSWQNFKTTNTTAPACSSADNSKFGTASNTADVITISSSDNNKWACFRVKNTDNVYFYVKKQIDFNPPVVTITQANDSLQATTAATDIPDNAVWEYNEQTTNPTCKNLTSGWVDGSKARYISFSKYYCFRIKDSAGNTGYGKIKPTIPDPGLVARQTQTKISASASSPYFLSLDATDNFATNRVSLDGDRLAIGSLLDDGKNNSTTWAGGSLYIQTDGDNLGPGEED